MPELPDLHVYAENLKKSIINKTITSTVVYNPYKINRPEMFEEITAGTNIRDIIRDGKELFFMLENNNCFSVHLMLSGKFTICDHSAAEKINAKIAVIGFDDSSVLTIADYQGLCKVTVNPLMPKVPDALSDGFTPEYFRNVIQKNAHKNIKAVLIDQHVVRGIGNAYVDEILWKADISPESVSGKIPAEKLNDLYQAILFILNDAIQNIKKISPDIISGEERSFLRVHNPRKKHTDEGDKIIIKTVAQKKTYFTNKQQLFI